jgi:hypothetical protein
MRGRPVQSVIRQNIIEILHFMGKGYGYDIYRIYCELFPKVTLRSIYYHLKKGVSLEEFQIEKIVVEHGDYSWGKEVEKIYYTLGKSAEPKIFDNVKQFFDNKKQDARVEVGQDVDNIAADLHNESQEEHT